MSSIFLAIDGVDYSPLIQNNIERTFSTRGTTYVMLDGSVLDARSTVAVEYRCTALYSDRNSGLYHALIRKLTELGDHTVTMMDNGEEVTFAAILSPADDLMRRKGAYAAANFSVIRKEKYA